jgi:hypothetical protein
MRQAIFIASVAVMALVGCETNRLDDGLKKLVGQDIHEAVSRLGPPHGQPTKAGTAKIYAWTTSRDVSTPMSSTQMTSGGGGRMGSTASVTAYSTVTKECTVLLAVDQNNQIKSYQYSGDGCVRFYGDQLNR